MPTVAYNPDDPKRRWISGGQPLTRVTVKVATTPAPWEVLTAERSRTIARDIEGSGWPIWAEYLLEYAAAVDAMNAPTRLVYETE